MAKKLAITVSGAVSLGSFEAGVMYEIINAIGQHNRNPMTGEAERIEIDVLTGASAGGMTATICAQKLLFEADSLDDAYNNALYAPWVATVNIIDLLEERTGDSRRSSILSSKFVEEISRRYITARYASHLDPVRKRHDASAGKILLGLALSNMNGVDYGQPVLPDGKFIYTRFQDELYAEIENVATDDSFEYWDALRNAAVSCGAFPFAFKPVTVPRSPREYPSENLETRILESEGFCYTDGGVFQNEPLGMAKNLVDRLDPDHTDTANRYYLYVSPGEKKSVASSTFNADKATLLPFAMQLMSSVFYQSRFRDWIMAEKVNSRIDLLNERAKGLSSMLQGDSETSRRLTGTLRDGSASLLAALFGADTRGLNEIDGHRERLRILYDEELAPLSDEAKSVLVDSILTLEAAAGLTEKDEMRIIGITARDEELASSDLFAFAGFFDLQYRRHDYELGRKKVQELIRNPACPLGRLHYTPGPIGPIDPALDGMKLEKMPSEIREQVCDRFADRMNEFLQEAGLNFIVRAAVMKMIVKPKLRKFLKL